MQDLQRRGMLFVLSGPSASGKTSIGKELLTRDARMIVSVSVTTRPRRPGEADGKDYFFVTREEFETMIKNGEFLEHAEVYGNYYGTKRSTIEKALAEGHDVLFDIDWQGTQSLSRLMPDDVVSIFLLPPSYAELERRLRTRAQDDEDIIQKRLRIAADDLAHYAEYRYAFINSDFDKSVANVYAILQGERLRRTRQIALPDFVNELVKQA